MCGLYIFINETRSSISDNTVQSIEVDGVSYNKTIDAVQQMCTQEGS